MEAWGSPSEVRPQAGRGFFGVWKRPYQMASCHTLLKIEQQNALQALLNPIARVIFFPAGGLCPGVTAVVCSGASDRLCGRGAEATPYNGIRRLGILCQPARGRSPLPS